MRLPSLIFVVLFIAFVMIISGCSTATPVKRNFPEAPSRLMVNCPQLEKLQDEVKLSDVAKTVTLNYTTYYECAVKNDAWIEWYQIQKHIFESVK
jgi:hypothetical protein